MNDDQKSLVCQRCKSLNPAGAQFCSNCNAPLSPQASQNPNALLIGGSESGGGMGGRVKLVPTLLNDESNRSKTAKAPSRLAQAVAKRGGTNEDNTPNWLQALRDNETSLPNSSPVIDKSPPESSPFVPNPLTTPDSESFSPLSSQPNEQDYIPIAPALPAFGEERPPAHHIVTNDLPDWLAELRPPLTTDLTTSAPAESEETVSDDRADLTAFNPASLASPQPSPAVASPPKLISTEELGSGIPDWLKDLTGNSKKEISTKLPTTDSLGRNKNTSADLNIPDWLRGANNGGDLNDGTSFGDVEIERTLDFAFGEESSPTSNLLQNEPMYKRALDEFEPEPSFGLTDELGALPDLTFNEPTTPSKLSDYSATRWNNPDYATYATQDNASALPPLDFDDLEPFELELEEADPTEAAVEAENHQKAPLWGTGLAPWLVGLRPPTLETSDQNLPDTQAAALFAPDEDKPNWLAEMTDLAHIENETTEENPLIRDVPERRTETRPFSVRDMLHETDELLAQTQQVDEPANELMQFTPIEAQLPNWLENQAAKPDETNLVEAELPDWLENPALPLPDLIATPATAKNIGPVQVESVQSLEPPTQNLDLEAAQPTAEPFQLVSHGPGEDTAEAPPNWLQDMVAGKPVAPVNTYSSTGRKEFSTYTPMATGGSGLTDELPDWLREPAQPSGAATDPTKVGLDAAAVADTHQPKAESNPSEEEALLDNLFGTIATSQSEDDRPPAEAPAWLQEPDRPTVPIISAPSELPEWLQEPAQPISSETNSLETQAPEVPIFGELAASDFLSDSDVPAWLRTVSAPPSAPTQAAPSLPETTNPGGLPAWLRSINSNTATEEAETSTTNTGLPFGLGLPRVEVPPTLAGAAVLSSLLRYNPTVVEAVQPVSKPKTSLNSGLLIRYLTYLALLGVVILGLLSPVSTARLTITPPVQNFYNVVDSLNAGQKVLIAYDWEADKSGEMRPLAQTVTAHLLNKRAQLVAIGLNPQGPALADEVTNELISNPIYGNNQNGLYDYGKGYVNLGFVPGSEAAVRSLFTRLNTLSDYRNNQSASAYPIMNGLDGLAKFDLVIVLAGDETSVRTWIEQFGIIPGSKLLLGVPSAVGPIAQPYAFGPPSADPALQGQLVRAQGLLVGLNGATQYQQLLQDNKNLPTDSNISLGQRLTAQSLGALVLIVLIVIANVVYFLRKRD